MSLGDVAAELGSTGGIPSRVAAGYSIDSRTIGAGELFFAIRGPRFDGHDFVLKALERGAVGAVVEPGYRGLAPRLIASRLIPVQNTTEALQRLALAARKKWGRRLVAITGSAGKTTTKEMLAAILAQKFPVLKSPGNLNNEFGVPLTLLRLDPSHQVAVLELAMSAAGEIARLARLALPEVGVVTNVAPVHLQFFDSVNSIALAKRELVENLTAPASAILNFDDLRVRKFGEGLEGRVVTFGFDPGASIQAKAFEVLENGGSHFKVMGEGIDAQFHLPLPGRHNVQNALAALATAGLFEVPQEDMAEALANFQTLYQRSEILALPGDVTLLNDSYNSNPLALERMLETLAAWPAAGRRIAVLGEMLELGSTSPELHKKAGQICVKCGVDWLLAVQGDTHYLLESALKAGMPQDRGRFFATAAEAGEFCLTLLRPGAVVLVKGSRGVQMEKVVEVLRRAGGSSS